MAVRRGNFRPPPTGPTDPFAAFYPPELMEAMVDHAELTHDVASALHNTYPTADEPGDE